VTTSRHTHSPREVGFFVEAALSPLSVSSVEWSDNGGVVEIYTTPDPLHTLRDIDNWTRFTKPGSSGTFNLPADTRKVAIEATSHDTNDPSAVTVVSDGVTNMEQARLYGVDQLDSPSLIVAAFPSGSLIHYDATDLSTLFQDTAGTVPVAVDGDPVRRVNNKGSIGGFTSRATQNPEWDTGLNAAGGILHSGNNRLVQNFALQDFSGGYTMMTAAFPTLGSLTQNWWAWDGFRFSLAQNVTDHMAGRIAGSDFSTGPGGSLTIGLVNGAIQTAPGDTNKFVSYSETGDFTNVAADLFPANNTDFVLGANSDANLLPWTGVLLELAMWAPALTTNQRAGLELYMTGRFGIVWV